MASISLPSNPNRFVVYALLPKLCRTVTAIHIRIAHKTFSKLATRSHALTPLAFTRPLYHHISTSLYLSSSPIHSVIAAREEKAASDYMKAKLKAVTAATDSGPPKVFKRVENGSRTMALRRGTAPMLSLLPTSIFFPLKNTLPQNIILSPSLFSFPQWRFIASTSFGALILIHHVSALCFTTISRPFSPLPMQRMTITFVAAISPCSNA
jgi:hypothetical protein